MSYKKMAMFLILAPGVFFLVYWLYISQSNIGVELTGIPTPTQYVSLNRQVTAEGIAYTASGSELLFTDTLDLSNNTAVADPGHIFAGLSLTNDSDITVYQVQVIDSKGQAYRPLDVEQEVVSRNFNLPQETNQLFLFKVNKSSGPFFLQLNNDSRLTWRFE